MAEDNNEKFDFTDIVEEKPATNEFDFSDVVEEPVKKKAVTVSKPLVEKPKSSPSPYAPEQLQSKSVGSTSESAGLSSDSKSLPKIKGEAASKLKEVDNQISLLSSNNSTAFALSFPST